MAVVIRLRRTGTRNRPSYRVVVAEKSKPRDGRFIETLGYYDPLKEPAVIEINAERAVHWLQHGAKPSETVASLLKKKGISREGVAPAAPEPEPTPEPDSAVQPEPASAAGPSQPSPIG